MALNYSENVKLRFDDCPEIKQGRGSSGSCCLLNIRLPSRQAPFPYPPSIFGMKKISQPGRSGW